MPSFDQVIVWMVVGSDRRKPGWPACHAGKSRGLGWSRNLGLGLAGALVGGFLFRLPGLFPGLDSDLDLIARYRGGRCGLLHRARSDLALAEISGAVTVC